MILRLDPRVPLVWRTTTSLQLGGLRPLAVFPDVSRDDETLIAALRRGTTPAGLDAIASVGGMADDAVPRMLERVRPALLRDEAPRPAALVVGDLPVADAIDRALRSDGRAPAPGRTVLAVIVAAWAVLPADAGRWLRRDIPHLPIVLGDGTVAIGPLVRPGQGPCLHCLDRHRLAADPAWPAVAGQLLALPPPELTAVAAAHVLSLSLRAVVAALEGELPDGRELRLDTTTDLVSETIWTPHPDCGCAAPPGSGSARADDPGPLPRASAPSAG